MHEVQSQKNSKKYVIMQNVSFFPYKLHELISPGE